MIYLWRKYRKTVQYYTWTINNFRRLGNCSGNYLQLDIAFRSQLIILSIFGCLFLCVVIRACETIIIEIIAMYCLSIKVRKLRPKADASPSRWVPHEVGRAIFNSLRQSSRGLLRHSARRTLQVLSRRIHRSRILILFSYYSSVKT